MQAAIAPSEVAWSGVRYLGGIGSGHHVSSRGIIYLVEYTLFLTFSPVPHNFPYRIKSLQTGVMQ